MFPGTKIRKIRKFYRNQDNKRFRLEAVLSLTPSFESLVLILYDLMKIFYILHYQMLIPVHTIILWTNQWETILLSLRGSKVSPFNRVWRKWPKPIWIRNNSALKLLSYTVIWQLLQIFSYYRRTFEVVFGRCFRQSSTSKHQNEHLPCCSYHRLFVLLWKNYTIFLKLVKLPDAQRFPVEKQKWKRRRCAWLWFSMLWT